MARPVPFFDRGLLGTAARILKERTVPAVSLAAALATALVVPPDAAYLGYFDLKVLACLLSILAIVAALRNIGAFDALSRRIVARVSTCRTAVLALVGATLALSMVVTNDMALIMMLPLAAATLVKAGWGRFLPFTFVMQNMAANLGGMIVPFGNPQNLYLFEEYAIALPDFLRVMAVPFLASCALILASCLACAKPVPVDPAALAAHEQAARERFERKGGRHGDGGGGSPARGGAPAPKAGAAPSQAGGEGSSGGRARRARVLRPGERRARALFYALLLVLVVLAVFRIVPYPAALAVVFGSLLFLDRAALRAVDYSLVLTFACFFVFSGNMARIPVVVEALGWLLDQSVLLTSAALSQVVSNVPAAILLSHLTGAWQQLLVGVNVGGAGTLVASLATLITLAHYRLALDLHAGQPGFEGQSVGRFVLASTAWGFGFLAALLAVSALLGA